MNRIQLLFLFTFLFVFSCKEDTNTIEKLQNITSLIKNKYAPDKRVEIFDITFSKGKEVIILDGETTSKEAFFTLIDSLEANDILFDSKVRVLPDSVVGDLKYAIARNSVINIRSKPKHSAELGTQGLLGMPLKVLDKKGDFYRVQTPDNYISWVDKGGITRVNKEDFKTWNNSEKLIYTQNFGYVYKDYSFDEIISDISLGGILKIIKHDKEYYEVEYPDKRTGLIKIDEGFILTRNKVTSSDDHEKSLKSKRNSLEADAKKMLGFPYLWGGTSAKGMDCSGFTKMVYLINGFIIPRDASQQINAGQIVDKNLDFSDLQKGDLLFFGKKATAEKKQRVTHVGLWLGNGKQEFIHSSGNVHISSMDSTHLLYDEFNKSRYLGSRRYLGVKDDDIVMDLK